MFNLNIYISNVQQKDKRDFDLLINTYWIPQLYKF